MFDVAPSELLLVALVALVVIGPKDLPRAMRFVGQWVGRAKGMARHFRSGIDAMVRDAEIEEMEKKWAAENARIMREHPAALYAETPAPAEPASAPQLEGPAAAASAASDETAIPAEPSLFPEDTAAGPEPRPRRPSRAKKSAP